MRSMGTFRFEGGFLAPASKPAGNLLALLVATSIGVASGTAVVLSLENGGTTENSAGPDAGDEGACVRQCSAASTLILTTGAKSLVRCTGEGQCTSNPNCKRRREFDVLTLTTTFRRERSGRSCTETIPDKRSSDRSLSQCRSPGTSAVGT